MLRLLKSLRRVILAIGVAAPLLMPGGNEATTIVGEDENANQEQVDDQSAEKETQGGEESGNGDDHEGGG